MVNVVHVVNMVNVASVANVIMWSVLLVLFWYCTLTTDPLSTTYPHTVVAHL